MLPHGYPFRPFLQRGGEFCVCFTVTSLPSRAEMTQCSASLAWHGQSGAGQDGRNRVRCAARRLRLHIKASSRMEARTCQGRGGRKRRPRMATRSDDCCLARRPSERPTRFRVGLSRSWSLIANHSTENYSSSLGSLLSLLGGFCASLRPARSESSSSRSCCVRPGE